MFEFEHEKTYQLFHPQNKNSYQLVFDCWEKKKPLPGADRKRFFTGTVRSNMGNLENTHWLVREDIGYTSHWMLCNFAGLPVVDEVFKASNYLAIVKDLEIDGNEIVGKGLRAYLRSGNRFKPSTATFFKHYYSKSRDNIVAHLLSLSLDATNHDILLAPDDPMALIVNDSGKSSPVLLDLMRVKKLEVEEEIGNYPNLRFANDARALLFVKLLDLVNNMTIY